MIKVSWTLAGEHADEWTGADVQEGAVIPEVRARAVVEASGMTTDAMQHWQETFLAPVVEALRTEGTTALARGESWRKAAGPFLACAAPAA